MPRGGSCFVSGGIKQQSLCILDDAILPPVGEISAGGIGVEKTHNNLNSDGGVWL